MRYAIMGATVQQVKGVGGTDIIETRRTGIIFATLDEKHVVKLKGMGCSVSKVGHVKATVMPPTPIAGLPTYSPEQLAWTTGLEDLRGIVEPPLYGDGFNIAVVDTGIRESHEKIGGRIVYRKNYTSDPMQDGFDHGTGVASIIATIAPQCNILNLKVLDNEGSGTEEEVILAIDDCIALVDIQSDMAPSVINLSLGSPDDGNPNNPLRVACRVAIESGLWVIAAAGNEGPQAGTIMSPACEKYVGAVGSAKYIPEGNFVVSDFSSRGPTKNGLVKPDTVAFGEDIVMASSSSDTATVAKSGTSFATPFISGMSILYLEGVLKAYTPPGTVDIPLPSPLPVTPPGIKELIDYYLDDISVKPADITRTKDNSYGHGMILGSLIAQALAVKPAVDISAVLTGLVAVAMMAVMVRAVG
jgi:serine protease AprX